MPNLIRFGEFTLDPRSGELLRRGSRVKLQNQPLQVLMLLLERPDTLVTREELRERLWPQNTFVDFDLGLNKAINALRRALGDHAGKPRFVETFPRRGYRFVSPLEATVPRPESERHHPAAVTSQDAPRIDGLAVLPLENLSGDPAQEYFSDGMTAELIAALASIGSLRVISRTSAMTYKGARKPLPTIAKQLNVDAVLEGSVARSDHRVRITAELVHARDDRLLWCGQYERDLRDVLQLQGEIAQSIAAQIKAFVDPEHARRLSARRVNPGAYEAWLEGTYFREAFAPENLERSIVCFSRAVELEPAYAQAHGDLAQAYFYRVVFGIGDAATMVALARASATRALELDPAVATAHIALSVISVFHDWDWARAESACRRAVELSPGHPFGHAHLADTMSIRGRHDEAIEEFRRVIELDPISRTLRGLFGLLFYRARRYDECLDQCRRALEIAPDYVNARWFMAWSLEAQGDLPGAIRVLEQTVSASPAPHFRALLARAYGLAGDRIRAVAILDELTGMSRHQYVSPFDIAVIHAGLGDTDAVFHWLEEAYRQRVWRIIELTLPMFDALRADPRWHGLVGRIGLPH
jgi:TolB-like protein/Tfp pilus assembly protein PilF